MINVGPRVRPFLSHVRGSNKQLYADEIVELAEAPDDDPLAPRGIPVFKPSLSDFLDFEGYMERVECWGMRSGIVKVIPPKEWYAVLRVNYRKCLVQTCSSG